MAKLSTLGAVAILSCALAGAVNAQQATKSKGHPAIGTVGAASKNDASDSQHRKSDVPGRPGVSCQRDTFFTGNDGQRHLCK